MVEVRQDGVFDSLDDPLGRVPELAIVRQFVPLGIPVVLRTNSAEVGRLAGEAFACWDGLDPALRREQDAGVVTIVVASDGHETALGGLPTYRLHEGWLLCSASGVVFSADRHSRRAIGFVTPKIVANEDWFYRSILECMTLFLATSEDRVPVHASVVVRAGRALVVAGPSGCGKSTLTYALSRSGWSVLAEEVVFVSLAHGPRLWGHPTTIGLSPESRRFFPEVIDTPVQMQPNGKMKACVAPRQAEREEAPHTFAGEVTTCCLERGGNGEPSLERLGKEDALQRLAAAREPGFDLATDFDRAARYITSQGTFLLRSGGDVWDTVALIEKTLCSPPRRPDASALRSRGRDGVPGRIA
jgi:hypothetical protein